MVLISALHGILGTLKIQAVNHSTYLELSTRLHFLQE